MQFINLIIPYPKKKPLIIHISFKHIHFLFCTMSIIPITKFINKLKKFYNLYYYNSPLPVLSKGEAVIFQTINFIILSIGIYYTIFFVPMVIAQSTEKIIYYLTGHHISLFGLLTSSLKLVQVSNHSLVNNITLDNASRLNQFQ